MLLARELYKDTHPGWKEDYSRHVRIVDYLLRDQSSPFRKNDSVRKYLMRYPEGPIVLQAYQKFLHSSPNGLAGLLENRSVVAWVSGECGLGTVQLNPHDVKILFYSDWLQFLLSDR